MKRFLCLLIAALMITVMLSAVPLSVNAEAVQTRTVMLYIIGSNLERDYACATYNLVQSMEAEYDENLNFIVMTGGSKKWHTEAEYLNGAESINPAYNQIWVLDGKRDGEAHGGMTLLEPYGIEGYEQTLMTEPDVLTAFIDYCYTNYPSDQYDIIMWDHGGGPAGGFGNDDRSKWYNVLSLSELEDAFAATKLTEDGKRFEIIDFDACLMSSVEVVTALSDFTDYIVASPELEPGYGQSYTPWLNAIHDNPSMNGFDIGKVIVDSTIDFYTSGEGAGENATLSVIDTKNYKERLLPKLAVLDELLISEANTVGRRNNRYNFYDEFFSLKMSLSYNGEGSSLYDLGNLASALSVPQTEMTNITQNQLNRLENSYTAVALEILSILADDDNSGDDVIYALGTENEIKAVPSGHLRDKNGGVIWTTPGFSTVSTTGISVFFNSSAISKASSYITEVLQSADASQNDDIKQYLNRRVVAAAYYSLIYDTGRHVSSLANQGERYISYRKIRQETLNNKNRQDYDTIINSLVSHGEFESADEAEDYLTDIVAQQSRDVVTENKVRVRQIKSTDNRPITYHVAIKNTSPQTFSSVNSSVKAQCKYTDTDEFRSVIQLLYDGEAYEDLYPRGISVITGVNEGRFDYSDYYDSIEESDAQIYQKLYASSSSVWVIDRAEDTCFVLYDDDGNPHITDIQYDDMSYKTAAVPIVIFKSGGIEGEDEAWDAFLNISESYDGWQIDGLTLRGDDESVERSYYSMDSEWFSGCSYTTSAGVTDAVYGSNSNIPISTFDDIDITKENWGITFGELPIEELDDVESCEELYYVEDVYGSKVDLTDLFENADEDAKNGDVVYDIALAEASVEPIVFGSTAQKPSVTLSINDRTLVEGDDYKVLYHPYDEPGEAFLTVMGIGDYFGNETLSYTVLSGDILGDVDKDGHVTIIDATFIQRKLAGIPIPFEFNNSVADVDSDGEVTIIDATFIQRWLANLSAPEGIGKPLHN